MKVHALGSGSGGNAIVLESDRQRILIDAGFGVRELTSRMKAADIAPASVSALIVTHEHGDHGRGAMAAARRWHWPVYATAGTLTKLRTTVGGTGDAGREVGEAPESLRAGRLKRQAVRRHAVDVRQELLLDDFSVRFIRAPHDAREHVALVVTSRSSGERAGIAYDIGHVTERFVSHFVELDVLLLESNHDDAMLRTGPYPWPVKERVAGPLGHLSNKEAALMARACAHGRLRHLLLCHLSETNNRPELALKEAKSALRGTAFRGTLRVAKQDETVTLGRVAQMELAL